MSASLKLFLPCITLVAALNAIAQDAPWLTDARKVATSVPPRLLQVLNEEIAKGGPESAIVACSEKAPQMAKAASEQSGWMVRRVSLRNRNPKAAPDADASSGREGRPRPGRIPRHWRPLPSLRKAMARKPAT